QPQYQQNVQAQYEHMEYTPSYDGQISYSSASYQLPTQHTQSSLSAQIQPSYNYEPQQLPRINQLSQQLLYPQQFSQQQLQQMSHQQPLSQQSLPQPILQPSPSKQILQQPLSQSLSQQSLSQPLTQLPLPQSLSQQPLSRPLSQQLLPQPLLQQSLSQSFSQQSLSQSLSQPPLLQPLSQQPLSQSLSQQPLSQSLSQQPLSQSLSQQPLSQSLSQQSQSLSQPPLQQSLPQRSLPQSLSQKPPPQSLSQKTLPQSLSQKPLSQQSPLQPLLHQSLSQSSLSQQQSLQQLPSQLLPQQPLSHQSLSHQSLSKQQASQQLPSQSLLHQPPSQQLPSQKPSSQQQLSQQPLQKQPLLQQELSQQPLSRQSPQKQPPPSELISSQQHLLQPTISTPTPPETRTHSSLYQSQLTQQQVSPQQESQLLPYQLLWYLTEHYLSKAASLPTGSLANFPKLPPQHQQHILAAIKCLEAVIASITSGNSYMPLVELKTRFRLSQILFWFTDNIREAESHLQKAILVAQKLDNATEIKFKMIDLQCNILKSTNNLKAARNLMKSSVVEAMERNMPDWTYHFLLQRAEFHYAEGDFNGCLSILKQAESMAEQRGDYEMKACILISITQYASISQNYSIAQHSLSELSSVYFPSPSQTSQTCPVFPISNDHLRLYYSLLFIIFHMHTGNVKIAIEKLTEVHRALDQNQNGNSLDDLKGYTKIQISAAPTSTTTMLPYSSSSNSGTRSLSVLVRWLSKAEIYTLTFLISGICNRGDTASSRATTFLTEGLRIVEKEINSNDDSHLPVHDAIKTKQYYVVLKAYILQHLVDNYILKSKFVEAEMTLAQLMKWVTAYDLWSKFRVSVTLALGMLNQCVGKPNEAVAHYMTVEKISDNREIRVLSKINRALLVFGRTNNSQGQLQEEIDAILKEINQEMILQSNNVVGLRSALHLLEALACSELTRTREHLHESLKLSSTLSNHQLKALTLSVLGALFCATQNDQAEKTLAASYLLSKNSDNNLGCLIAGRLLKDIYAYQGKQTAYSKQVSYNDQHEFAVCKSLTDWNEKSRVVLDIVNNDVSNNVDNNESAKGSTSTIQSNAGKSSGIKKFTTDSGEISSGYS
ncbi:8569_t:CDS:10, partial [Acaulospora morrowiae]